MRNLLEMIFCILKMRSFWENVEIENFVSLAFDEVLFNPDITPFSSLYDKNLAEKNVEIGAQQ